MDYVGALGRIDKGILLAVDEVIREMDTWRMFLPTLIMGGHVDLETRPSQASAELDLAIAASRVNPVRLLARSTEFMTHTVAFPNGLAEPSLEDTMTALLAKLLLCLRHHTTGPEAEAQETLDRHVRDLPEQTPALLVAAIGLLLVDSVDPKVFLQCALLAEHAPASLALPVVLNQPWLLEELPGIAVDLARSRPEKRNHCRDALRTVLHALPEPRYSRALQAALVVERTWGGLLLECSVRLNEDPTDVLIAALQGHSLTWLGDEMPHTQVVASQMQDLVFKRIESLVEDGESAQVRLASYLRAVCGLVGVFGTALTKDQANTCMVTIRLCKSPRLAEVSMCLVVLCCASFSMPQLGDLVGRLLALGAGDFCALVAIRFRASFFEELRSNLQDVLQMPISIPDSCLGVMARVFASTAVPEDLISRALDPAALSEQSLEASISVAAQLCKGLGSNQLRSVSSGSLQRWVFRAMQLSTGTVHSELPSLVRQCAKLALRSDSSSKISAQLVLSVMRSGAASPSTKVLLLLYLLEYQSTLVFGDFAEVAVGNEYPPTMWNAVPIRELWLGSSRSSDRAIRDDVYPVLTGLLLRSRPQLLNPVPLVRAHLEAGDLGHTSLRVPNLLIELRNAASDTAKTLPVVRRLHSLAPAEVAQHAGDLLGLLIPKALSSRDSVLLAEVESLWHSIFPFSSDQYLIATVNLLRKPGSRPVGWEELVIDPLVLFQCSDAVFRSASLVRIFLAILTTFRSASRSAYDALYRVESRKTPSLIDASHIKAFLKLQECAVLQSLLKSCLLLQSDADALDARGAIFAYMHQQFIERPEYIQLVLLQGFDSKLMEPVVAGIPSLHVAFDFSTQLVTTTFGIEFLALLTAQYPIKRSLEVAQRVLLPRLQTLLSPVAAFNVALQAGELDVSLPVVPKDAAQLAGACLTLARTFPELSEGIIAILRDANVDARALEGRTDGPVEAWSTYRTIVDQTIEDLRALQRRAAGPT